MEITLRNLMRVLVLALLMSILPVQAKSPVDPDAVDNGLLVLSYHDIRDDVRENADADAFAVSTQNFAAHLDWLSAHDYHPISLSQLIKASQGKATLPPRRCCSPSTTDCAACTPASIRYCAPITIRR